MNIFFYLLKTFITDSSIFFKKNMVPEKFTSDSSSPQLNKTLISR